MTITAENYLKNGVDTFILLDFDGVINVDPVPDENIFDEDVYTDRRVATHAVRDIYGYTNYYKLRWSPLLINDLSEILSNPRVNLLWLTTWRTNIIPVYENILNLSYYHQPHVFDYEIKFTDFDSIYSKTTTISDFLDSIPSRSSAKVAWVDDVLVPYHQDYRYSKTITESGLDDVTDLHLFDKLPAGDFLAIGPNPAIGLRPSDVDELRCFTERG